MAERADGQRVDAGREAVADRERFDTERAAQSLVLVFRVTKDERAVTKIHHAQAERLGGCGFASAGFAEAEDVRVGDRDLVVENPADRVGVERPTR